MSGKKCSCGCGRDAAGLREYTVPAEPGELTLADLPVGATATIVKVKEKMRGRKKFADVGMVAGAEIQMEAHAPFGGLLRVKVMETSMALHRDAAADIVMSRVEANA